MCLGVGLLGLIFSEICEPIRSIYSGLFPAWKCFLQQTYYHFSFYSGVFLSNTIILKLDSYSLSQ